MKDHDETKLPKWAQERMAELRREVARCDGLQKLHHVMCEPERDWYTFPGPPFDSGEEYRKLFLLNRDSAVFVGGLGPGDSLFVGRAKKGATA